MDQAMKPSEEKWYFVHRKNIEFENVLVQADTAQEAKEKAKKGEYDEIYPVGSGPAFYGRAVRTLKGKPRDRWSEEDYRREKEDNIRYRLGRKK